MWGMNPGRNLLVAATNTFNVKESDFSIESFSDKLLSSCKCASRQQHDFNMLVQYQNLPVQNIPALLLSCGFLAILFRSLVLRVRYYRKAQAWGCKPVPSRFQWDPFWGLDLVWSQWKALRGHYYIPWLSDLHKGQPKTFQITFQGARVIHTIEPENLKCLTAINWKDFGISPLRRGKKAGHPFADRGVNSVDGEDWVFSRSLIKPFFMREVYANTERLLPHPDHLLRIMPPDGETFNIQPYLQRWVRFVLLFSS